MSTTRQFRTNLNCGNCVAAVTPYLNGDPAIKSWRVDTANPDKVLTVEGDSVTADEVASLVSRAGFRVLGEIEQPKPSVTSAEPPQSYYPLALIVAYLVGLSVLPGLWSGTFQWMTAMRHFMAGFFLAFSFFKLLNLTAFADAYAMYDVIARRWRPYGFAYPFIELALGVAYLLDLWPVVTNWVTLAVMLVGSVGVIQSLLNRRQIRCACLGTVFNLPMSTVTLIEDIGMAAMAAAMLFGMGRG